MSVELPFFDRQSLIDLATEQAGCRDFGEEWFFSHLDRLIESLHGEARLSESGVIGAKGMIVGALVNRLRHVELVKQNSTIKNEKIHVAAIVVGLPRTGSTMMHRMLCAADGMTAVKWYEAQNYAPFPDEARGDPTPRKAAAKQILEYMLTQIPELMSIHPMSITQADEEVIILGQLFSSSMIESTYYVPSYADWLMQQDRQKPYEDLKQILQSLQWQDPGRVNQKWVLKTPGHLMALEEVMNVFPEAKIVMTHRDPVDTVPSYCSMEASLYRMGSDDISKPMIGAYWLERLKEWTDEFMRVRSQAEAGTDRFIDIKYADLLKNPVQTGEEVLKKSGVKITGDTREGMGEWIEANKREHRAPHQYEIGDFDLTASAIEDKFAFYRRQFIL